jgi:hypothetical protein
MDRRRFLGAVAGMVAAPLAAQSQSGSHFWRSRIGSVRMERDAYLAWRWTWNRTGTGYGAANKEPQGTNYTPERPYQVRATSEPWHLDIHEDTECDDLQVNLAMWFRTGIQSYLDRARMWLAIYRDQYPFDWRHLSGGKDRWGGDYTQGNAIGDHCWGWGLLLYFEEFGDANALDAARSIGNDIKARNRSNTSSAYYGVNSGQTRRQARQIIMMSELYRVTREQDWLTHATEIVDRMLASTAWDARGGWFGPRPESGITFQKSMSPVHFGFMNEALWLYYLLTNRADVRDRLLTMANFARDHGVHRVYPYTGNHVALDYPSPGAVWHIFDPPRNALNVSGGYVQMWVNSLARAYILTKDRAYLDRAKFYWQCSVGIPLAGAPRTTSPGTTISRFMNRYFPNLSSVTYLWNADFPYMYELFPVWKASLTPTTDRRPRGSVLLRAKQVME